MANTGGPPASATFNPLDPFGTIPGVPPESDPTVELRELYLRAQQAASTAALAAWQAQQAASLGNAQLAAQMQRAQQQSELERDQLAQQASQFAQQFGLQEQDQQFRQGLAQAQLDLQKQLGLGGLALQEAAVTGQFGGQQTLAAQELAARVRQADQGLAQAQQRLNQAQAQFEASQTQQDRQFNQQLVAQEQARLQQLQLERDQLAQQQAQFAVQQTGFTGGQATLERQRVEAEIAATQERIRIAEDQGNEQLALQERQRLDQLTMQQNTLAQQESEFARQFGLQEAGLTGTYGGEETLEARRQRFAEEQFLSELAANPRNVIQAALAGRRGVGQGPVPVPPALSAELGGGAPGVGPVDVGLFGGDAAGGGAPAGDYGQSLVPVASSVQALLGRSFIPQAGQAAGGAPGSLVTLEQLQTDPNLRITPERLDLASVQNLSPTEEGFLQSTLSAQGTDEEEFERARRQSYSGQQGADFVSRL